MKKNTIELPGYISFMFIALSKCALFAHTNNISKKDYIKFCEETWETCELNGWDKMEEIIQKKMMSDIVAFGKDF